MHELPSQQTLDALRNKRNNSSDKLISNKRSTESAYTEYEKNEKNEIRVELPSELMETHQRIQRGIVSCRKRRTDNERFQKSHARLLRILSREYLPALDALQEAYPREALEAERDALLARLERGWQMEDSAKVARTFSKLLTRYEVLSDALDGDVINRTLDRVERVAA